MAADIMRWRSRNNRSNSREADERRMEVMNYINEFWTDNYCPPTLRDISAHTSVLSISQVHSIILDLEQNGLLLPRQKDRAWIIPAWVPGLFPQKEEGPMFWGPQ